MVLWRGQGDHQKPGPEIGKVKNLVMGNKKKFGFAKKQNPSVRHQQTHFPQATGCTKAKGKGRTHNGKNQLANYSSIKMPDLNS